MMTDKQMTAREKAVLIERARNMVRSGGPHEWGYRDLADGRFVADPFPFQAAQVLASMTPEPAQPAESPEAREFASVVVQAVEDAANDDCKPSEAVERILAASTARPTERGAVEARQGISINGQPVTSAEVIAIGHDLDAEDGGYPLLATDQAAEVEAGERVADAVHAELWKADEEIKRLRYAMNEIDVLAGTTLPSDGPEAAFAALESIIKLIHPFRINAAALATQPATGRTMGGEVAPALFDAIVSAVEEAANGICDPSESVERIVAALQNGGE
jgi:hypothetical protein